MEETEAKSLINQAVQLLGESTYKPKDYAHWVKDDSSEKGVFYEDGSCETFCNDCINEAVERKRREHRRKRNDIIDKFDWLEKYGYYYENHERQPSKGNTSGKYLGVYRKKIVLPSDITPEQLKKIRRSHMKGYRRDVKFISEFGDPDFGGGKTHASNCDDCGAMFDIWWTADDEEMWYWEGRKLECIYTDEEVKWEFTRMLDHYQWCKPDIQARIIKLVQKVISLKHKRQAA